MVSYLRRPLMKLRLFKSVASPVLLKFNHKSSYIPDYYTALGISKTADVKEIKLAYFRMAKKYHPDTNQTPEAKWMFQFIAEAYEVLTDDMKRQLYDKDGIHFDNVGGMSSGPQRKYGEQSYTAEELFSKIFGEAANPEFMNDRVQVDFDSKVGHDVCHEFVVDLTFEQACLGVDITIPLNVKTICYHCLGSRSERGYQGNICPYCEGTGLETERMGLAVSRKPCSYCDGSKIFIKFKCHECHGYGYLLMGIYFPIKVPPGCEHGQLIKVYLPEIIMEAAAPDQNNYFFLKVMIDKSNYFKRDELDLTSEADLSISQALLGGELVVRGLHKDDLAIPIPEGGTSSHQTLVASGQGVPRPDKVYNGHHFVKLGIKVPKSLSERQREIFKKFSQLESPPENGVVDNGIETMDGHRYKMTLIRAAGIRRNFAQVKETEKEKSDKDEDEKSKSQPKPFERQYKKYDPKKNW